MKKMMCMVLVLVVLLPVFPFVTQVEVKAAISSYTTTINGQTLPFADYPVGSYFTDNGKACTDHGTCGAGASFTDETACNCKCTWSGVALRSTSCMGFASMVFYRLFGHTIYSQTTNVVSDIPASSINATYLYNLFTNGTVKPGAHIRNSSHSMIFMGCDATYIYTYEGNYDGKCGVGVLQRTWEEMSTDLKKKGGIKYIQMSNTSYTVPETPTVAPSNPQLTVSSKKVAVGETITFNYSVNDAERIYIPIDVNGVREHYIEVSGNSYSISFF